MLNLERSTQAVLVVTSLISAQIVSTVDGWAAGFLSCPQIATLESNKTYGCVRWCVRRAVFVCPVSVSRPVCWKWIHYWNSLSLKYHFSEWWDSLESDVYFVCEASVWLGCQVSLTRGWVLARGVRCVSQLWHCLTPDAFEWSFKACLAECFSPHVLAPFTDALLFLLLYLPSSSLLCFSTSLLPSRPSHLAVSSILLHTVSSDSACMPVRDTAGLNFDLGTECSARDQWSQWWQAKIWKQRKIKKAWLLAYSVSSRNRNFYLRVFNASCFRFRYYEKKSSWMWFIALGYIFHSMRRCASYTQIILILFGSAIKKEAGTKHAQMPLLLHIFYGIGPISEAEKHTVPHNPQWIKKMFQIEFKSNLNVTEFQSISYFYCCHLLSFVYMSMAAFWYGALSCCKQLSEDG